MKSNPTDPKTVQWKGTNRELAVWMQEKLEAAARESGTCAVCAAACADGRLLEAEALMKVRQRWMICIISVSFPKSM